MDIRQPYRRGHKNWLNGDRPRCCPGAMAGSFFETCSDRAGLPDEGCQKSRRRGAHIGRHAATVRETTMKLEQAPAALGLALATTFATAAMSVSAGAVPMPTPTASAQTADVTAALPTEFAQYRRGYGGPRHYAPGPRYYGPPRAYGGGWGYRPWYRRPYYGTIIGGIALGSIIGVTAYGLAPRPPRPDLCWFWADEYQSRGYWDYC